MTGDLKSHIGARVKQARRATGLTQADVAERLGKSVETISNIERGASWTSVLLLDEIATLLKRPIVFFFEGRTDTQGINISRANSEAELLLLSRELSEGDVGVLLDLAKSLSRKNLSTT